MIIKEKVAQAKKLLQEFNIDCWITFVRESQINGDPTLIYLTNGHVTWHSAFIMTPKQSMAIVGLYDKKGIEDIGAYDRVTGYVKSIKQDLLDVITAINPTTIAVNYSVGSEICDGLTHGMYLTLHEYLQEIGFADRLITAEKVISALRERKSATEIDQIGKAIQATEEIFAKVSRFIQPGMNEMDIACFMQDEVKKRELVLAWEAGTCPAVFTGPDTAQAHYQPTERKVQEGHILNMDFGVKVNGYCSDMQRTFYILAKGEKETPIEVKRGFATILQAVQKAKEAIKPGMEGWQIDKIARDIILAGGYEEFPHALGHQVGRYAHDGTALLGPMWEKYGQKPTRKLEKGMVFTIEPRLTVPGYGVVTIEEMICINDNGAEWLSHPQTQIILIKSK